MVSLLFCGGVAGANAPVITHGPLSEVMAKHEFGLVQMSLQRLNSTGKTVHADIVQIRSKPIQAMTSPVGQPQNLVSTEIVQVFIDGNPIGVQHFEHSLIAMCFVMKHITRGLFNFSLMSQTNH